MASVETSTGRGLGVAVGRGVGVAATVGVAVGCGVGVAATVGVAVGCEVGVAATIGTTGVEVGSGVEIAAAVGVGLITTGLNGVGVGKGVLVGDKAGSITCSQAANSEGAAIADMPTAAARNKNFRLGIACVNAIVTAAGSSSGVFCVLGGNSEGCARSVDVLTGSPTHWPTQLL